jgi:hypothetical protein
MDSGISGEGRELLVNLKNHKRAERPLEAEALIFRGESAQVMNTMAEEGRRREEAMARLRERALEDETLADLLLVLGIR